jgi:hypothetical protein
MNNINRNNILISLLIIILIVGLIFIIIILLSKFSNIDSVYDEMHSYKVQTPIKADGKNMNYCLPGCIRGTCEKNNNTKHIRKRCDYDFQCQYCQDRNSNMFYVNFDNERDIVPLYEEQNNLNKKEEKLLNDSITKNNIYIDQLNDKIKILNS